MTQSGEPRRGAICAISAASPPCPPWNDIINYAQSRPCCADDKSVINSIMNFIVGYEVKPLQTLTGTHVPVAFAKRNFLMNIWKISYFKSVLCVSWLISIARYFSLLERRSLYRILIFSSTRILRKIRRCYIDKSK